MEKSKSVFDVLSSVNLSGKVEKRGNLSYISWSTAWMEAKKIYPDLQRIVYESETGMNYHTDGNTCWVKVGIIINDIEHIDYMPVLNHVNKSIKLNEVTSFEINKSIMRSTAKALALHGLAISIYAKEDWPEVESKPAPVKKEKIKLMVNDDNWNKVKDYVVDNIGFSNEQVIKNLSVKYDISEEVKKEIIKLKS